MRKILLMLSFVASVYGCSSDDNSKNTVEEHDYWASRLDYLEKLSNSIGGTWEVNNLTLRDKLYYQNVDLLEEVKYFKFDIMTYDSYSTLVKVFFENEKEEVSNTVLDIKLINGSSNMNGPFTFSGFYATSAIGVVQFDQKIINNSYIVSLSEDRKTMYWTNQNTNAEIVSFELIK